MKIEQDIKVAVDAIVFGYHSGKLYLLLIKQKYGKYQGHWALPGGFVQNGEGLQAAVARELKEEAGVKVNYLEQLYTFGDAIDRDHRGQIISVAYFGLVNSAKLKLKAATDAEDANWFDSKDLPGLAYDHRMMVDKAIQRLQSKLQYQPIGFDLLDREFPFSDLEKLYQTILDRKIERRNFRRKILGFGILDETKKIKQKGSGRPAVLYKFNNQKYKALEKKGFHFEIKYA